MKSRCYGSKRPDYPRYGGRGISVCERWMSFDNFLADMGERPVGTTIDRIDSNGKLRAWETADGQHGNSKNVIVATIAG